MDIKKIVTDYIKADNTDYAIMVTGVWGSGKTFCWNHTLKQAIEEIKIPGQDTENAKKYSSARVSLFGLTDVNQIRKQMSCQGTGTWQIGTWQIGTWQIF